VCVCVLMCGWWFVYCYLFESKFLDSVPTKVLNDMMVMILDLFYSLAFQIVLGAEPLASIRADPST